MTSKHHSITKKWNKLLPQTHSPEVYYSIFMMVVVLVMSERLEKRPGATPVASGEQSLFLCFVFLLQGTPRGVFI
jgi:hypothetical protein